MCLEPSIYSLGECMNACRSDLGHEHTWTDKPEYTIAFVQPPTLILRKYQ